MYQAEKVKIDVDMAERYMRMHNLTMSEFGQKMGRCRSWWFGIRKSGGYMTTNAAKLMCHVLGMEYDKVVIPEPSITINTTPGEGQKPLYADDESIQGFVSSMNNIELTVKRIEIQMRTILKELGVK